MAARNAAPTVGRAVRSVLEQKGVRAELLIAEDASADRTWEVLRSFRSDPRVRLWRFRRKRGAGAARQFLLRRARGRYATACDADDRMLPGMLRRLAAALDRNPRIGVAFGDLWITDAKGRSNVRHRNPLPLETWDLLWSHVWNGGSMIRRRLLLEVGGYDGRIPFGLEDYDLFLRLAERTRFRRIGGNPLYLYRKRAGSLSDESRRKKQKVLRDILRKAIWRRYRFRAGW